MRTLTIFKAESSSPIRLTQRGPLAACINQNAYLLTEDCILYLVRSLRVRACPKATFFQSCLYPNYLARCCYPERNFVHNQLLGSSMSLSPLYASWINDLHVNTTAVLHQPFDWLRLRHVKITTFRVYARRLCKKTHTCMHLQTSLDFLAFAAPLNFVFSDLPLSVTP